MSYYKNTGNTICKCGEHEFSLDSNYVQYGDFHDGLLLVYDKNEQYHYLDVEGNCVINLPLDFIGRDFNKGYAKVLHRHSDHVGKINHFGHYVVTFQGNVYEISDDSPYFVSDGINGVSCACYEDGWKFIDYEGNILSEQYYSFISEPRHGYYILKKGSLMGLADSQGNEIIPCVMNWDSIEFFDFYAIIGNSFIIDLKGNVIIKNGHEDVYVPCSYKVIQNFKRGYAIVNKNGLEGLIDTSLNEVIPCIYDSLNLPENGYCYCVKDKRSFLVSLTGRCLELPNCRDAKYYNDDCIVFKQSTKYNHEGFYGLTNSNADILIPNQYQHLKSFTKNIGIFEEYHYGKKYGIINTKGQILIPAEYESISIEPVSEAITLKNSKKPSSKFHFSGFKLHTTELINNIRSSRNSALTQQKIVPQTLQVNFRNELVSIYDNHLVRIPSIYVDSGNFHDGLARVQSQQESEKFGLWGYINNTGQEIIPCKYTSATDFQDGYAVVADSQNRSFVITTSGEVVKEYSNQKLGQLQNGMIRFYKDSRWGFHSLNDDSSDIKESYLNVRDFMNECAVVTLREFPKKSWGVINKSGNLIFRKTCSGISDFNSDGIAKVTTSINYIDYQIEINRNGNLISRENGNRIILKVNSADFAYIGEFHDNLAKFCNNRGKWGFINRNAEIIVEPIFEDAINFHNGIGYVKTGYNDYKAINSDGNFLVLVGGRTIILPHNYVYKGCLGDKYIKVSNYETYNKGLLDLEFNLIIPIEYSSINFKEGTSNIFECGRMEWNDEICDDMPVKYYRDLNGNLIQ